MNLCLGFEGPYPDLYSILQGDVAEIEVPWNTLAGSSLTVKPAVCST